MGCLNVNIENRTVCDVKVDTTNNNVIPVLSVLPYNYPISVNTKGLHTIILINTENRNKELSVNTQGKNPTVLISIGLVCQVSLGEYRLFYVKEGPFIVEEGYFKVRGM